MIIAQSTDPVTVTVIWDGTPNRKYGRHLIADEWTPAAPAQVTPLRELRDLTNAELGDILTRYQRRERPWRIAERLRCDVSVVMFVINASRAGVLVSDGLPCLK
jgi:hypothetical protein